METLMLSTFRGFLPIYFYLGKSFSSMHAIFQKFLKPERFIIKNEQKDTGKVIMMKILYLYLLFYVVYY